MVASLELIPDIQRTLEDFEDGRRYSFVKIQVVFRLFKLFWCLFFIDNAKVGVFPKAANTLKMVFSPEKITSHLILSQIGKNYYNILIIICEYIDVSIPPPRPFHIST